ncbi:MAG: hypothetical protein EPN68_06200 [Rhodanobacter sp.]|uniref:hypothetical protein n=1 Tax=Rhodanobacter sp. FW021-MT20 TaxID=1162282 RepID=UPI001227B1CB|nr:MAG: hypothetical protein EPN68_06200 [Rhodanobacter sp.]
MRIDSGWGRVALVSACAVALALHMPSLYATTDTSGGVTLPAASVNASGITTVALQATKQTTQAQATASVLDPQPLLALAVQLQAAHANAMAAAVAAHSAHAEAKRSAALYHDGENTSLQQVQAAEAAAAQAQAQQRIAQAQEAAARSSARAQWGASLASLAARGPLALKVYADGHSALLAVVLPAGSPAPTGDSIEMSLPDRGPLSAHLIGASPRADPVVQGATFFYRADGTGLRTDQRLTVTVPLGGAAQSGVTVPAMAVIWYAGQPWVYVETAAGHYQRRPLRVDARDASGWFEASGFRAGERVVVRGGELLISQELLPPPGVKPAGGDDDDG